MLSLSLILVMLFMTCSNSVYAISSEIASVAEESRENEVSKASTGNNEIKLQTVSSRYVGSFTKTYVYLNGKALNIDARIINGVTYVATRAFFESATSMKVSYNSSKRTLSVNGGGLSLEVTDNSHIVYANGRVLFTMTPSVIMSNGRMYTPLSSIAKSVGLSVGKNGANITLSGKITPLMSADKFYREDAVYWLSRIISAESRGEPVHGQIAVGNVVMNRVDSNQFPNTIWGVIFDKKYGVQFSPIIDGSIYKTPTSSSVLAAKICLEGFSISEKTLFFLAPRYATSSWIPNSRTYEFTIANHDFYS